MAALKPAKLRTAISTAAPLQASAGIEHPSVAQGDRPDPTDIKTQLWYAAVFAGRFVGYVGIPTIAKLIAAIVSQDWIAVWQIISDIKDPDIDRIKTVIGLYANSGEARPFGYYATIVIANTTAGTATWVKDPEPWGRPET